MLIFIVLHEQSFVFGTIQLVLDAGFESQRAHSLQLKIAMNKSKLYDLKNT